jgi:hypothetical protein
MANNGLETDLPMKSPAVNLQPVELRPLELAAAHALVRLDRQRIG